MSYRHLCLNYFCNKPFDTCDPHEQYCSPPCASVHRDPRLLASRFWPKVRMCSHGDFCPYCCWPWTAGTNAMGYGLFGVREGKKWFSRLAHTVAWGLVNARPIPEGLQINHHCDNPPCCSLWHIYAGTPLQNILDAQQRGRLAIGEARSSLTVADVLSMRECYRQGYPLLDLAKKFHVGQPTIYKILSGETWKHVQGALSVEERHALVLPRRQMVSRTRKRTVLTEDKVKEIRALAQEGVKRAVLAQQFGVSLANIKAILKGRIWKDIS